MLSRLYIPLHHYKLIAQQDIVQVSGFSALAYWELLYTSIGLEHQTPVV